ncbi:MAG TPA: hypothetical protein VK388_06665 [Pyrinomonadaceae bacterium]|nr:hypothetical protein [Pyrinomonadaceae bacterium]
MMEATSERAWELILEAYRMGDGDAKIALLEEAARLADICGDLKLASDARDHLVHAATFGGAPEKALVAFSWMLAQYDRGGQGEVVELTVLWQYKWILDSIANFPQIGKAQILEMLDDMAARYRRAGYSLRPNYLMRYRLYKFWDEAEAARYFHKGHETPRDDMSDCRTCELNDVVGFALREGDDARAVELASPILEGRMRCASIPKTTFAKLLLPLVRLGRMDEAENLHREGYRLVALAAKGSLSSAAEHLEFLVVTENFDRAVRIFERHLADAYAVADAASKFDYYLASWFLLERLGERGRATLKLQRVPRSLPVYEESGTYTVARLAAWFLEQCETLAARFDARNESDYYMRSIREAAALRELTTPHPIRDVDELIG